VVEEGVCDSCGAGADDLVGGARPDGPAQRGPAPRHYVTPERWDTPGSVQVVDEVERWCFACRTHYPHEGVDAS
jgi:hypothetical protein